MQVVRDGRVTPDAWRWADDGAAVPDGDVVVTAARWRKDRVALRARSGRLGVCLAGDDDPATLVPDVARFALIALEFDHFTDGRNYSTARLLRERFGYTGELRAVGDILRDQIFFLARCGIDAFEFRDGQDPQAAMTGLRDFSVVYQAAADARVPAYRARRGAIRRGAER